jgi:hypothetical protein
MTRPKIILNATEFRRMYNNKGIKLNVIASHFCVSTTVIHKNRKLLNLPLRLPKVHVDEEEFLRLDAEKLIYDTMAKTLGVSRCTVISIRQRLNLPARNNSSKRVRDEL